MHLRRIESVPVNQRPLSSLLPSPENVVDDVRAELEELSATHALSPIHIDWAIEQLVESGVELPLVMATVFDFAPPEWLGKAPPPQASEVDFDALAALLGIDPKTGKPIRALRSMPVRPVHADVPPSSRTNRRTTFATAFGSEGMRQRPLAGWSKSR